MMRPARKVTQRRNKESIYLTIRVGGRLGELPSEAYNKMRGG